MYIETKDAQISGAVGRYSKKFAQVRYLLYIR